MHDRNGTPLKIGDRVIIEAVIAQVYDAPEYCNATVSIGGDKPHGPDNVQSSVTLNTRQLLLLQKA